MQSPEAQTFNTSRLERASAVITRSLGMTTNVMENIDRLVTDLSVDSALLRKELKELMILLHGTAKDAQRIVIAIPRLTRILREAGAIVLSYRLATLRNQFSGHKKTKSLLHTRNAQRLYTMCANLGGTLIKFAQLVSTRGDLLPAAYIEELSQLQDQAPTVESHLIVERIENELGAPIAELFSHFDPQPLAAASLAQVHGGKLLDGTEVVIKVQLPGVEELVLTDLLAIRIVAKWLDEWFPTLDLITTAEELTRSIGAELDYAEEAKSAINFQTRFKNDDEIAIPSIVLSHSSARVLTMERFRGIQLSEYLDHAKKKGQQGEQCIDQTLTRLIRFYGTSIFRHGVFHSDPHAGNFMVLKDGRLGILDFGSVEHQPPEVRLGYGRFVSAMMRMDTSAMSEELKNLGFEAKTSTPNAIDAFANQILFTFAKDLSVSFAEIDPIDHFSKIQKLAKDSPIRRIPHNFVMLSRVLLALSGFMLRYKPRLHLPTLLLPYLAECMAEAASAQSQNDDRQEVRSL